MTNNLTIAIIAIVIVVVLIFVVFHHKYQTKEEREANNRKLWIAIIIAIAVIVCIYVFSGHQKSQEYGLKTAAQTVAGKAILKAGGLLDCPKGQKCFCSQPTNTCKFVDKNKVYQDVKKYHDIHTCASHCLGKTAETAGKGEITGKPAAKK